MLDRHLHHLSPTPTRQDTHDAKIKTDLTESYQGVLQQRRPWLLRRSAGVIPNLLDVFFEGRGVKAAESGVPMRFATYTHLGRTGVAAVEEDGSLNSSRAHGRCRSWSGSATASPHCSKPTLSPSTPRRRSFCPRCACCHHWSRRPSGTS
ncbi:hypothetical protein SGFS_021800 [Streptomyces graminofaciens]|uniref:Uncharacterized protein n=1 Tax=Streptomyces graminofaciens TaxID=68212 RepID=A0ABN5VCI6_9ACTN|nr:hypothetical protein SGFS_021800 [Streptomyces graminofaciens]